MIEIMSQIVLLYAAKDTMNETERGVYEAAMTFVEMHVKIATELSRQQYTKEGLLDNDFEGFTSPRS